MKRIILLLVFVAVMSTNAWSYLSELKVLSRQEIEKLTDAVLLDTYIDLLVELQAADKLHAISGFAPKEYENYKGLLRFKILLLEAFDKRKLQPPRTDASQ